MFSAKAYTAILRFRATGGQGPGIHVLTRPRKLYLSLLLIVQRFFDSGRLVARDPESMFGRALENYICSVMAYMMILRFRASGGQGPRIHVLTRPRKLYILCDVFCSDCLTLGIWSPGAQSSCFDAPSKTTYFLLSPIRRLFDFGSQVARDGQGRRIQVWTRP